MVLWLIIIIVLPKYIGLKHAREVMDWRAQRIKVRSQVRERAVEGHMPSMWDWFGDKAKPRWGLTSTSHGKVDIYMILSLSIPPSLSFTAHQPSPVPSLIAPSKSLSSSPTILSSRTHMLTYMHQKSSVDHKVEILWPKIG